MTEVIHLKNALSLELIEKLIYTDCKVEIDENCLKKVDKASQYIKEKAESGAVIYWVTTWFWANSHRVIDVKDAWKLQRNLLLSHASGVWEPFMTNVPKLALILRIVNFLHWHSGIRRQIVLRLADMYNENMIPVVPSQWSVWASGDLAPLSHMWITLLGEWEVDYKWQRMSTKHAFELAWRQAIELTYKEWLAFNNWTTFIEAQWLLNIIEAKKIALRADAIAWVTLESQAWRDLAFDEKPHLIRPHKWQIVTAKNIRSFLKGSELFWIDPKKIQWKRISPQDSYSLRCIPQVHGASKNAIYHIEEIFLTEANSVTDNPLIFVDEDQVISAWNFHWQPLALTMDYMKIAIAELWSISERRSAKLVDVYHNEWLPAFLEWNVDEPGLHSWFMIPQYAAAAVVSENKVLCHPASCDSIPTSANIEDHVSMWTIAARQAWEIIGNVYKILAIELLMATQAVDLRLKINWKYKLWKWSQYLYDSVRKQVSFMDNDRFVAPDIEIVEKLLKNTHIFNEVCVHWDLELY